MKRVRALKKVKLSSGVIVEPRQFAWVVDSEAERLVKEGSVAIPYIPENRTYK